MRVVIAAHGTRRYGGIPKYSFLLAMALAKKGVQVRVLVDDPAGVDKLEELQDGPRTETLEVVQIGRSVNGALSTLGYCAAATQYLSKHDDFDILHTSHVTPLFYLRHRDRKPVVFQPFGNELFSLAGHGMNPLYCKLAQPVLRFCGHNADRLLMEGEFQRADMTRWYDNADRMRVLPVGIDVGAVPRKQDYTVRGHRIGERRTFRLLTINSLYPYEGINHLINAFRSAHQINSNLQLAIVGKGPMETELRAQAGTLPITFMQDLSERELGQLRAASDCYISTSNETDFQMGILEAMATGLPIIGIGRSWLPLEAKRTTSLLLAKEIIAVSHSSVTEREEMGRRMVEAVQAFDMGRIADQAIQIYRELRAIQIYGEMP